MKKLLIAIIGLIAHHLVLAQEVNADSATDAIVAEAKELYRSEMASWYGTDVVVEKHPQKDKLKGYLSYAEGEFTKCLFFSNTDPVKVMAVVTFDSSFSVNKASINFDEREPTEYEKTLYTIRRKALEEINTNKDSLFKFYKNTSLNLIPIVYKGEKKVYVLTGPSVSGVVVFGNDYLFKFDENNNILSIKRLHKNIIPINYGEEKDKDGNVIIGTMHSHLPETGEFMTPTDICTLMLYGKMANWKQHTVMSQTYMNIWDCEKKIYVAITREAMDKINQDQKERKKKSKN